MRLTLIGFLVILVGMALVIIGSLSSVTSPTTSQTQSSAVGGVILIGPFPIVFGYGNTSQLVPLFVLGIAFTLIALVLYLVNIYFLKKMAEHQ